ncbi:MAG: hypothetical protein NTV29_00890 [Planctomycetota bacterium]|jgi:hypothetical protein|nr:hypothetical protein [Planctomycetota bacterium]
MPRLLCLLGLVVAGLVLLLFLADLALSLTGSGGIFSYPSMLMDIAFIVASAILGYLAWSALKELK